MFDILQIPKILKFYPIRLNNGSNSAEWAKIINPSSKNIQGLLVLAQGPYNGIPKIPRFWQNPTCL